MSFHLKHLMAAVSRDRPTARPTEQPTSRVGKAIYCIHLKSQSNLFALIIHFYVKLKCIKNILKLFNLRKSSLFSGNWSGTRRIRINISRNCP